MARSTRDLSRTDGGANANQTRELPPGTRWVSCRHRSQVLARVRRTGTRVPVAGREMLPTPKQCGPLEESELGLPRGPFRGASPDTLARDLEELVVPLCSQQCGACQPGCRQPWAVSR